MVVKCESEDIPLRAPAFCGYGPAVGKSARPVPEDLVGDLTLEPDPNMRPLNLVARDELPRVITLMP